jgi:hypothetical protein
MSSQFPLAIAQASKKLSSSLQVLCYRVANSCSGPSTDAQLLTRCFGTHVLLRRSRLSHVHVFTSRDSLPKGHALVYVAWSGLLSEPVPIYSHPKRYKRFSNHTDRSLALSSVLQHVCTLARHSSREENPPGSFDTNRLADYTTPRRCD